MPYPMGNIHPRFWSWYMGSSNFTGALGDFLAAVQGSNLGGGNHAAALMDQQVVDWCKEMMGFPRLGQRHAGQRRLHGQHHRPDGGAQRQGRHRRARARRRRHRRSRCASTARTSSIPATARRWRRSASATGRCGASRPMPACASTSPRLRAAIARGPRGGVPAGLHHRHRRHGQYRRDRRSARRSPTWPREEDLWFHVDGCIGALIAIAPQNAHRVAGIERADSVALDPHKWLHAPFEVGCALVRDAAAHRSAFAVTPEYLESTPRGLASGRMAARFRPADDARLPRAEGLDGAEGAWHREVRPADRPEHRPGALSRRPDRGRAACSNWSRRPTINIVCFRYRADGLAGEAALKALNIEIMLRLQEAGHRRPLRHDGPWPSTACGSRSTITAPGATTSTCWCGKR